MALQDTYKKEESIKIQLRPQMEAVPKTDLIAANATPSQDPIIVDVGAARLDTTKTEIETTMIASVTILMAKKGTSEVDAVEENAVEVAEDVATKEVVMITLNAVGAATKEAAMIMLNVVVVATKEAAEIMLNAVVVATKEVAMTSLKEAVVIAEEAATENIEVAAGTTEVVVAVVAMSEVATNELSEAVTNVLSVAVTNELSVIKTMAIDKTIMRLIMNEPIVAIKTTQIYPCVEAVECAVCEACVALAAVAQKVIVALLDASSKIENVETSSKIFPLSKVKEQEAVLHLTGALCEAVAHGVETLELLL